MIFDDFKTICLHAAILLAVLVREIAIKQSSILITCFCSHF
jgi:hypothetical protein